MTLLCACSGPVGPIPGGKLEGEVQAWPQDWAFTDHIENVLLETDPMDPYSVTVWAVYVGSNLYVGAGDVESRWAQNMRTEKTVVVAIQGRLFEAEANMVTANDETLAVIDVYQKKYEIEDWTEFVGDDEGAFFRLTPRPASH